MFAHLPPLPSLRAFEAAARCGSFKEAAAELNVTQAAISHQIKALEADLGFPLFYRQTRKVALTDRAEGYAEAIREVFDGLRQATDVVTRQGMSGQLRITTAPFYGNRTVLPRLNQFYAQYPDLQIVLDMQAGVIDFKKEGFDAGIRYGHGRWPGMEAILLHRDVVAPMTALSVEDAGDLPLDPEEIAKMTLGYAPGQEDDWARWLTKAGLENPPRLNMIRYDNRALLIDLALSGSGVVLVDQVMMATDLENGSISQLHPTTVERDMAMWVVYPKTDRPDPRVIAFAEWLQADILERQ